MMKRGNAVWIGLRGSTSSKVLHQAYFTLHEEWEKVVIHRDIKASNVLLDSEMNGRLGDFGLARLYDHGSDPKTTHVVGTIGYIAPELGRSGKATPLTDIFAFGTEKVIKSYLLTGLFTIGKMERSSKRWTKDSRETMTLMKQS